MYKTCYLLVILVSILQPTHSQSPFLSHTWKASWIDLPGASPAPSGASPAPPGALPALPGVSPEGYGVYLFRKAIDLETIPDSMPVFVSADNRYKLYVNDSLVSLGPARSDIAHWKFATVDIAPYLRRGRNCVAAQVWNEGEDRQEAQLSLRTGFILQSATREGERWNTDTSWIGTMDSSYAPIRVHVPGYYVAGPGERIDMHRHIQGWTAPDYATTGWRHVRVIAPGVPRNIPMSFAPATNWLMVPSTLPAMELTKQRLATLRRAEGVTVPDGFPRQAVTCTIPAHTTATLLLDQGELTNAYPTLVVSGGESAGLSLTYAESLYTKVPIKGDRDQIDNKIVIGRKDSLIADGTSHQVFTTLNWRTYRYIQLRITTHDQPLTIDDCYGTFTGYPFRQNASLDAGDTTIDKLLSIGWHTARLCAVETYMDCPYYEQLQYIGDTRIQALVSLYNSGDDRLVKNSIEQLDLSRRPEGVTLSRYPTQIPQLIPPFSLWWIGMLHDYWMYGRDTAFATSKLPGVRQVLNFFHGFQQEDGSLKGLPYWTFTDWVNSPGWETGMAPAGADGHSSVLDLQLLWAYQLAAEMEARGGMPEYASLYRLYATRLKKTIREKYWDSTHQLFADRPEKDLFSQHANTLAILTGVAGPRETPSIVRHLLTDTTLAPASIYFKYYLHQALTRAGYGNDYLRWLDKWRENIRLGLTTWAEMSDIKASRSDCHAWGASPNIELFRTVLGFDSEAPGFTRIKVEPHLGAIQHISGHMPHPSGILSASYQLEKGKWNSTIELPPGTRGRLLWHNRSYPLHAGINHFTL